MREAHSHNLNTPFDKKCYRAWKLMKSRCFNKNCHAYPVYGGVGITVCSRWEHSFENFRSDIGNPPTLLHTLDRISNSKGYSPSNCRWATRVEQSHNRRSTVLLTFNGKTRSMKQWATEIGISHRTLWARMRVAKWGLEKALTTPLREKLTV